MNKPSSRSTIISTGLAIFAMLFGAGNVIFPLALGRDIGDNLWFGLAGFFTTAVLIPLLGLIAVILCDGKYEQFLQKMGRIPGFIITLLCMLLIGPMIFTPRCITISYASVQAYLPDLTLFMYSIITAGIIFLCTFKPTRVIDIISYVLGPIKTALLFAIIAAGMFYPQSFIASTMSGFEALKNGLNTGYGTADLLGTIFFSGLIYTGLKKGAHNPHDHKELAFMGLKAGLIGAFLLGFVYAGFCVVAAFNGAQLQGVRDGNIFSVLVPLVLGPAGGFVANATIAVSTMTTAIALTSVVTNFFHRSVFCGYLGYLPTLLLTITTTTMMSNLGFDGIMKVAVPIIFTIYPAFIALAITSSLEALVGFRWVKTPVMITLIVTIIMNFFS